MKWHAAFEFMDRVCIRSGYRSEGRIPTNAEQAKRALENYLAANSSVQTTQGMTDVMAQTQAGVESMQPVPKDHWEFAPQANPSGCSLIRAGLTSHCGTSGHRASGRHRLQPHRPGSSAGAPTLHRGINRRRPPRRTKTVPKGILLPFAYRLSRTVRPGWGSSFPLDDDVRQSRNKANPA
jgi:hypothetical protein